MRAPGGGVLIVIEDNGTDILVFATSHTFCILFTTSDICNLLMISITLIRKHQRASPCKKTCI
jgi:hypothetical protein